MLQGKDFYIYCFDVSNVATPLKGKFIKRVKYSDRSDVFLVEVVPPLSFVHAEEGLMELSCLAIASKAEEYTLSDIRKTPVPVYVLRILTDLDLGFENISDVDAELIDWALIFSSKKAAVNFGKSNK